MSSTAEVEELVWVSPLNSTEFVTPEVKKKCPWAQCHSSDIVSPHSKQDWKPKHPKGVYPDVLSMIGNTPMVKLNNIPQKEGLACNIYAKCEFLNPGGSIKDRMVKRMFEDAEREGLIKPGMIIIEPSSGNTGIAIATVSALKGYGCIIVMAEKISDEKEAVITALGASVVRVPKLDNSFSPYGLFGTVNRLRNEIPNSFVFDQFNNPGNPITHYDTTANEILDQLDRKVDMVVFGGGTGGTITGVGRKFREVSPETILVGFDPEGSKFAFPDSLNSHPNTFWEIEGIGYEFVPGALDRCVCDYWIKLNDKESLLMARRLMKEEGLLVGMSSGAAVAAAVKAAKILKKGDNVVVFMADSIRNYMTKFVSDRWMEAKGFQPCLNTMNLWWWDMPVSVIQCPEPLVLNITDTLQYALKLLQVKKKGAAIAIAPNGLVVGIITADAMRNKIIAGILSPIELVERCTIGVVPFLEISSTLGRAYRIIEKDRYALVVNAIDSDGKSIGPPLKLIEGEDLYAFVSKRPL